LNKVVPLIASIVILGALGFSQEAYAGFCSSNAECDDLNPCTTDTCLFFTCFSDPATAVGASCDDGSACTTSSVCDGSGGCSIPTGFASFGTACGSQDDTFCDDPNFCNGIGFCLGNNQNGLEACDDANSCTTGTVCFLGFCTLGNSKPVGSPCNDQTDTTCNKPDTCNVLGQCLVNHTPRSTLDTSVFPFVFRNTPCEDGSICTLNDFCDGSGSCTSEQFASAGSLCSDGELCNGNETCDDSGTCQAGTPLVVDDGNSCTADSCDPVVGVQNLPLIDGTACADGTVCNGDEVCQSGSCVLGTTLNCNDGDQCTTDSCDEIAGCENVEISACFPDDAIGGEIIPIETTSLILAGAQSFSWMIPVTLSVLGIGLFVVSRKSENS